jgi:transposase-like protein
VAPKLTNAKRSRIKRRLNAGETVAAVARSEKVSYHTAWRIKHGVSRATKGPRKVYRVLSVTERATIVRRHGAGESLSSLAREHDVAVSTVSRLCNGQTGAHAGAR